jgi:hypothetical protein
MLSCLTIYVIPGICKTGHHSWTTNCLNLIDVPIIHHQWAIWLRSLRSSRYDQSVISYVNYYCLQSSKAVQSAKGTIRYATYVERDILHLIVNENCLFVGLVLVPPLVTYPLWLSWKNPSSPRLGRMFTCYSRFHPIAMDKLHLFRFIRPRFNVVTISYTSSRIHPFTVNLLRARIQYHNFAISYTWSRLYHFLD